MFTDNYIKLRNQLFFGTAYVSYTYHDGTSNQWPPSSVSTIDIGTFMKVGRCRELKNDYMAPGIYFGTGNTPAARTDLTLEGLITSGLEITSPTSLVQTQDAGVYEISATFTIKNTSDANITIAEVGAFTAIAASNVYYGPLLLERTVLDTPITIAPGNAKVLTYKMTFKHR